MKDNIVQKEIMHSIVRIYENAEVFNYMIIMLIDKGKILRSHHVYLNNRIYYTGIEHFRVVMIMN